MEENWSSFLAILDQTSHLLPKKWFQFPPGCFFSITYHHIFANFELIHSVTLCYINTEKSSNKNLIIQGVTRPNLLLSLSPRAYTHLHLAHIAKYTSTHASSRTYSKRSNGKTRQPPKRSILKLFRVHKLSVSLPSLAPSPLHTYVHIVRLHPSPRRPGEWKKLNGETRAR